MVTFGKRLNSLRKERKLTQKQLAQVFNISESGVGMFERDEREPSFELTKKIADYFEVSTDYLMGRSVSRAPDAGRAFYGGGKDWTPEELEAADAYIEMLRQKKKERQERDHT